MAKNLFNSIKLTRPKSNVFDLSHDVKLSLDMGELVPIMCTEAVPGDRFNISAEAMIRLAPLVAPIMHRIDVTMHYFFVPNRILWPDWETYITGGDGGIPTPAFPTVNITQVAGYSRLCDYFGIPYPSQAGGSETISAIPFAAYQRIWQEYYADQNIVNTAHAEERVMLDSGDNTAQMEFMLGVLRKRAWEHDYFTSALPFAQKGDVVDLPLAEFNDVGVFANLDELASGTTLTGAPESPVVPGATPNNPIPSELFAATSELLGTSTTINDLRTAFRLQEWLEKNARGGTRYIENILVHFGIKSSDKRLQRPEYICGTKTPVVISEVLNTSATTTQPQGDMAGHGIAVASGAHSNYRVEEHGYVIGIMSVMPKTAYQNGIPRHFLKISDPTEFYWPSFAHLGEQAIYNKEIFAFDDNGSDTFGYIPRYAEYKFENNRVAGDFRSTFNHWHMGRIFTDTPTLSASFIEASPTKRVFAVTSELYDSVWAHVYNKVKAIRPMPKYGTPQF